jgi:hypothetical protein
MGYRRLLIFVFVHIKNSSERISFNCLRITLPKKKTVTEKSIDTRVTKPDV